MRDFLRLLMDLVVVVLGDSGYLEKEVHGLWMESRLGQLEGR